jgi:putative hemolysin
MNNRAVRRLCILCVALVLGSFALEGIASATSLSWRGDATSDPGSTNNYLQSVACVSSSFCIAGGGYAGASKVGETLIEKGPITGPWTLMSTPNTAGGDAVNGVACTTTKFCTAVGYQLTNGNIDQTLALSWSGTKWSLASSANEGSSASLAAESCVKGSSPALCFSVGSYTDTDGISQPLIESWNGSKWIVAAVATVDTYSALSGVSCVSSTFCMAVGYHVASSGNDQALVEKWNGTKWAASATPSDGYNLMTAVSCASSKFCMSSGIVESNSGRDQTLIERWNGSKWSISETPDQTPSTGTYYNDRDC